MLGQAFYLDYQKIFARIQAKVTYDLASSHSGGNGFSGRERRTAEEPAGTIPMFGTV